MRRRYGIGTAVNRAGTGSVKIVLPQKNLFPALGRRAAAPFRAARAGRVYICIRQTAVCRPHHFGGDIGQPFLRLRNAVRLIRVFYVPGQFRKPQGTGRFVGYIKGAFAVLLQARVVVGFRGA